MQNWLMNFLDPLPAVSSSDKLNYTALVFGPIHNLSNCQTTSNQEEYLIYKLLKIHFCF